MKRSDGIWGGRPLKGAKDRAQLRRSVPIVASTLAGDRILLPAPKDEPGFGDTDGTVRF
jgi:hypothetical protein